MKPAARTILVTGGLGFIGRHVCRHFHALGDRVVGSGHGNASADELRETGLSRWHAGDVRRSELEKLAEPISLIVHCAGSGVVAASFANPEEAVRNNVDAANEVLEFARQHENRPRVVVLSSAAVYGSVSTLPICESTPCHPISPYGQSKLAIEQRCLEYGREHGLEIAIVRLFSIYGRGLHKQLFWDACRKLDMGDGRFGGTGEERRDWLHVDDAVRLIDVAGSMASAAVPIINGGAGHSTKVRDALMQLRALWPAPAPEITFSGEARIGDPPGYEADITRARDWGWTPVRSFADGLADYVAWAHGALR